MARAPRSVSADLKTPASERHQRGMHRSRMHLEIRQHERLEPVDGLNFELTQGGHTASPYYGVPRRIFHGKRRLILKSDPARNMRWNDGLREVRSCRRRTGPTGPPSTRKSGCRRSGRSDRARSGARRLFRVGRLSSLHYVS